MEGPKMGLNSSKMKIQPARISKNRKVMGEYIYIYYMSYSQN